MATEELTKTWEKAEKMLKTPCGDLKHPPKVNPLIIEVGGDNRASVGVPPPLSDP